MDVEHQNLMNDVIDKRTAHSKNLVATTMKSAHELALAGYKTSYLLNGGALFLMPTIVSVFSLKMSGMSLTLAALSFVLALGCTFVSHVSGYESLMAAARYSDLDVKWLIAMIEQMYIYPGQPMSDDKLKEIDKNRTERDQEHKSGNNLKMAAISLLASAMLLFCAGAGCLIIAAQDVSVEKSVHQNAERNSKTP